MCGIVGYVGTRNAVDVLSVGLSHLEYRGYDSVGLAIQERKKIKTYKEKGKIKNLEMQLEAARKGEPSCGIGHTRWATHGRASKNNAHPHGTENVVLVHNGIIENYLELKEELLALGYSFVSETDSEVAAKYLDYLIKQSISNQKAIELLCDRIRGSYAFAIMFLNEQDVLYGVRHGSPLCLGIGKDEMFLGSDMSPILSYTNEYILLDDREIVRVESDSFVVYRSDGIEVKDKVIHFANWNQESSDRQLFEHFMLKEIHEQPDVLDRTLRTYTQADDEGSLNVSLPIPCDFFTNIKTIHIIACGTALYAGLCAKYWIEAETDYRVMIHTASEFRYYPLKLGEADCAWFISQSGETADSLACLRMVSEQGIKTLGIVNTQGSSIAREVDVCIYTCAGFEKSVASTKAYTAQIALLYLITLLLQESKHPHQALVMLQQCIRAQQDLLEQKDDIQALARKYLGISSVFFLGRGLDFATSVEASLKLKEVSYVMSDAYPAGELKHGTLALIDPKVLSIVTLTQMDTKEKTLSNLQEVQARSGQLLLMTSDPMLSSFCDDVFVVPKVDDKTMPFISIIAHQLFAYYSAKIRDCDIDCPRNLAKSVTVE
ncbi:glutamine--fructose-6-phosphate transaminase (isomerizing) [Erysipelothrix rhusiopathiae]|uniref:glutamine--fructose-6-phosphate transaminase (isomerizing) n=1 Tax=Erysipelothrix sp. strain 2 (EsS2-7-Brazil) TaxID=2500579 RepID=UPI00137835D8|nr:glutamine--fructose-6-phosphate transaminase (isomerizing) [Erysipelothrix sp. strain 2 (EsS2-7-Brazil)]MBK2404216.1 glutamine--fructose-6-phosphate transaminase (isomerizing) [Erysipelothrix sp. strain 2 (EsS2-7-Brazil)]NBA00984.1 glutamine--fructose-6-phosphate transaminase (isomerizing) [Erysipelothrix rhusiopathiae]